MTIILSVIIFSLVIAAMAVGVIFGRKPIKGSCGGMSSLGIDTACDICGGDANKCEEEQSKQRENSGNKKLAYEVKSKI